MVNLSTFMEKIALFMIVMNLPELGIEKQKVSTKKVLDYQTIKERNSINPSLLIPDMVQMPILWDLFMLYNLNLLKKILIKCTLKTSIFLDSKQDFYQKIKKIMKDNLLFLSSVVMITLWFMKLLIKILD